MPKRKEAAPPDALNGFARQIKQRRRQSGMSQAKLAELAGTTQATVSAIEAAKGNPTIGLLNGLASVFRGEVSVTIKNWRVK